VCCSGWVFYIHPGTAITVPEGVCMPEKSGASALDLHRRVRDAAITDVDFHTEVARACPCAP
jgi:hypothetical protein